MNDILPDGITIIPYRITLALEKMDELWNEQVKKILSENNIQFSEEDPKP